MSLAVASSKMVKQRQPESSMVREERDRESHIMRAEGSPGRHQFPTASGDNCCGALAEIQPAKRCAWNSRVMATAVRLHVINYPDSAGGAKSG